MFMPCYLVQFMLQELMLKPDEHNITVDQVPPNRALFVQPHLPVWAGLSLGYRSAFYEYHQRGEVMHARYPGPVGGDNLDIQSCLPGSPRWDSVCHKVAVCQEFGRCLEDTGIPKTVFR